MTTIKEHLSLLGYVRVTTTHNGTYTVRTSTMTHVYDNKSDALDHYYRIKKGPYKGCIARRNRV